MRDKRQIIISICLIVMLILAIVGISYAAFSYIGKGSTVNQITTGTISMNYEESSNVIKITNALPTRDETGKVRLVEGEYFDFSVTTNISGNAVINFEIAAEELANNTFDRSNVKFYLTKLVGDQEVPVNELLPRVYSEETLENDSTGRPAGMMSLLIGSVSAIGKETTNYRLRLYVDENYNPQGDGGSLVFKTRINVYGKVNTDEVISKPMMKSYTSDSTEDYHAEEYRIKITDIKTKANTIIPSTALEIKNGKGNYWDLSSANDNSVISYIENDGANGYKLTIGGKNGILANEESNHLFANFTKLENIDLSFLDTTKVINMKCMFFLCSNLKSIDLSTLDTSNVTNMHSLFFGCNNLISLDLGNFNTLNVENMKSMFMGCTNLTSIYLNSFDTSNVTTMMDMFNGCSSLKDVDLRSFDTLKVTTMHAIFANCQNLTTIKASDKWITSQAITTDMFTNCGTNKVTIV